MLTKWNRTKLLCLLIKGREKRCCNERCQKMKIYSRTSFRFIWFSRELGEKSGNRNRLTMKGIAEERWNCQWGACVWPRPASPADSWAVLSVQWLSNILATIQAGQSWSYHSKEKSLLFPVFSIMLIDGYNNNTNELVLVKYNKIQHFYNIIDSNISGKYQIVWNKNTENWTHFC